MVNFLELSQKSIDIFKSTLGSTDHERYIRTLCVAISENNKVTCSYDNAILSDAHQCILIHCRSALAVSYWYNWYKPEFINHNGYNFGRIIGNDCSMNIDWEGSWSNQVMKLYHNDDVIYSCKAPFENHMQAVWNAYCDTLINEKDNIAELKTLLSQKEERIHVLEEQIIQYRNTVEKIRESIDKLGE